MSAVTTNHISGQYIIIGEALLPQRGVVFKYICQLLQHMHDNNNDTGNATKTTDLDHMYEDYELLATQDTTEHSAPQAGSIEPLPLREPSGESLSCILEESTKDLAEGEGTL